MVDIVQKYRGDGTTTRQIEAAPKDAIYIWPNPMLGYIRDLARKLHRDDLQIVGAQALERHGEERFFGRQISGIVVDHAVAFTKEQFIGHERLKAYVATHSDQEALRDE